MPIELIQWEPYGKGNKYVGTDQVHYQVTEMYYIYI